MSSLPPFPSLPENAGMEQISVSSRLSGLVAQAGPSARLYIAIASDMVPAGPSLYPAHGLEFLRDLSLTPPRSLYQNRHRWAPQCVHLLVCCLTFLTKTQAH